MKTDNNSVVITFRLEEKIKELLDRFAIKQGLPRSVIIRYAIEKLLKEEAEYEYVNVSPDPGRLDVVSFKTDMDMKERLNGYAVNQKVSRSEAVRYAIIRLLKEEGVLE